MYFCYYLFIRKVNTKKNISLNSFYHISYFLFYTLRKFHLFYYKVSEKIYLYLVLYRTQHWRTCFYRKGFTFLNFLLFYRLLINLANFFDDHTFWFILIFLIETQINFVHKMIKKMLNFSVLVIKTINFKEK